MKIKLTVLMTVYNDEKHISESIRSILNQSYCAFKFLIINDASNDLTKNIIESFSDKRIKLVNLNKNIGQTAALNYGLQHIDTEYVIRMDSDDISDSSRFFKMMNIAVQEDFDFLGSNCIEFNNQGFHRLIKKHELSKDIYLNYFKFNSTPFVHGSLLFKFDTLKLIKFYNEKFKICADLELYKRIYFNNNQFKIHNIQEPLYYIRRHRNQLTRNKLAIKETILIKSEIFMGLLLNLEFKKAFIVICNLLYFFILYLRPKR